MQRIPTESVAVPRAEPQEPPPARRGIYASPHWLSVAVGALIGVGCVRAGDFPRGWFLCICALFGAITIMLEAHNRRGP